MTTHVSKSTASFGPHIGILVRKKIFQELQNSSTFNVLIESLTTIKQKVMIFQNIIKEYPKCKYREINDPKLIVDDQKPRVYIVQSKTTAN